MKTKLSVIFDLPKNLKSVVVDVQNSILEQFENVKKTETDYHITLAYADNIEEDLLDEIKPLLKKMLEAVELKINLSSLGNLINKDNEGVVYIAIDNEQLNQLYGQVRKFLEGYGGSFTYPSFKGHMTLAYLDKPLSAEQLTYIGNIKLDEVMEIKPEHVRISVKDGDDWRRIGRIQISKRDVLIS